MDLKKYSLEIAAIEQDIEILKQGHIYENDRVPGVPKCSKVGVRLDENFKKLLTKIENETPGNIEVAAALLRESSEQ